MPTQYKPLYGQPSSGSGGGTGGDMGGGMPKKATEAGGGIDDMISKLFGLATNSNPYMKALSFMPGIASFLGGMFGKNDTSPPVHISRSSVHEMGTTYNAEPVLAANQTAQNTYNRAISRIGGAPKIGAYGQALSSTLKANNDTYAGKFNMEQRMRRDRGLVGSRIDMMQGQLDESRRRDYDITEGNLGWDGNMAQAGYRSITDAGLMNYRDDKRTAADMFAAAFGAHAISGKSGIDQRNFPWLFGNQ